MQRIIISALLLALFASFAVGQPQNGDLVLSVGLTKGTRGYTGYMSSSTPSSLTTLIASPTWSMDNWVRMAPDNTDLVIGRYSWATSLASGELVQVRPNGTQSTVLAKIWYEATDSFELDHDDRWIVTSRSNPTNPINNSLFGVEHSTGKAVGGDAVPQHPARLIFGLEYRHRVPGPPQVVGRGEAGRPRPDHGHALWPLRTARRGRPR